MSGKALLGWRGRMPEHLHNYIHDVLLDLFWVGLHNEVHREVHPSSS